MISKLLGSLALLLCIALPANATDPRGVYIYVVGSGYIGTNVISLVDRGYTDRVPNIGEWYKWQQGSFRFAPRHGEEVVDVQHGPGTLLLIILKSAEGCCLDFYNLRDSLQ